MILKKIFFCGAFLAFLSSCAQDEAVSVSPAEPEKTLKSYPNTLLDLSNGQRTVDEGYWKNALTNVWEGIKKRNLDSYSTGLIHRPKSENPGDAVSEGVGYGMLLALFSNDQETFNQIWEAGNSTMWSGCYYNWQVDESGKVVGRGAATDAEEDIALALIFADKLVSAGKWTEYTSSIQGNYRTHALTILDCMWLTSQITEYGTVAPGAGWGGESFLNPGYFSPAWYKIFAAYDPTHDWQKVVDRSYEILGNSVGYSLGLIPDWMTPEGGYAGMGLGYNSYGDGLYCFKDAIRTLWRVAIDALWFDEPRAKTLLTNAVNFINSAGGASAANFYQTDGTLIPEEDVWTDLAGGTITRTRREHSHLTIGMWATAVAAVGSDDDMKAFSAELSKFYENGDYFGNAVDPLGGTEDTLHNEMYFDQFLGWFGASMLSGSFVNVIDAIDAPAAEAEKLYTDLSYEE